MWSAWGSGTAPSSATTRNSLRNPLPGGEPGPAGKLMALTAKAVKAIGYVGVGTLGSSWTRTAGSGSWR